MATDVARLGRTAKSQKLDTEVAVLQVRVSNVEEKFVEIKDDFKTIHDTIQHNAIEHKSMLEDMKKEAKLAHEKLERKISALEKWRWMLAGAGIVIGAMGFEYISKLLQ